MAPSTCRSHHLARPPLLPELSLLLPVSSPGQTSLAVGHFTRLDISLVAGHITWSDLPCCRSLHQARSLSCCRPHHLARSLLLPVTSPGQTSLVLSLSLSCCRSLHLARSLSCCRSHHLARSLLLPVTSPGQTSLVQVTSPGQTPPSCCRSHHLARPLPLVAGHITWPDLSCCRSHHLARRLLLPVAVEGGVQLPGTWDCVRSRSWPTVACRLVGSSWRSTLLVVWWVPLGGPLCLSSGGFLLAVHSACRLVGSSWRSTLLVVW